MIVVSESFQKKWMDRFMDAVIHSFPVHVISFRQKFLISISIISVVWTMSFKASRLQLAYLSLLQKKQGQILDKLSLKAFDSCVSILPTVSDLKQKERTLRYAFGKKKHHGFHDFMDLMFRKYPPGKSHIPPKGKFGKSTQECRMGWLLHSRNRSVPLEATFINPFVAFHRSEVENAKLEANGADDGDLKKMGGHQLGDFWGWNLQMAVSQKNGSIVFKMILVFWGCICISFFVRNIISILSVLDHIPLIYGITRVAIYSPVAKCWQFVPSAQFDPISGFLHFSRWFFKTFESESLQSKPFAPCISHAKSKVIFAQGGQSRRWWL